MKKFLYFGLLLVIMVCLFIGSAILLKSTVKLEVDQYVLFGVYLDEPILWRVIHVDESGAPLLLSDKTISLKSFDAKGDKHSDGLRIRYGSGYWPESTIRQWLNSSEQHISWTHNEPTKENLCNGDNAYADEVGFLNDKNFTASDRKAIIPVTRKLTLSEADKEKSIGGSQIHTYDRNIDSLHNYEKTYYQMTTDRVFFLSIKELKDYLFDRGLEYRSIPTEKAVLQSSYVMPDERMRPYWEYWLMDPIGDYSCAPRNVLGDLDVEHSWAFMVGGVRPGLYLNHKEVKIKSGSGTIVDPYMITGKGFFDY